MRFNIHLVGELYILEILNLCKERPRLPEARDNRLELCRALNTQQLTLREEREMVDETNLFNDTIEHYDGVIGRGRTTHDF